MKASELISKLAEAITDFGDVEVFVGDWHGDREVFVGDWHGDRELPIRHVNATGAMSVDRVVVEA